jgi:HD-GYP domain-containing protein (c-di-GMP phosphodiesterase class II)
MKTEKKWFSVRKSHLKYYTGVELYYKTPTKNIRLYKPAGMTFTEASLSHKSYLGDLYIKPEDKIKAIQEAQRGFNNELEENIRTKDTAEVKDLLVGIVDETMSEPRTGSIKGAPGTVESLIAGYSSRPTVVKNLARIAYKDYTTIIHSINVLALTLGYCFYTMKSDRETLDLGLAALLHDVGKIEVPTEILTANRKLTDEEFEIMKSHPTLGVSILDEYEEISPKVRLACLEHHEKLDGSGYPEGKREISDYGQILAIIDCYEAITNDDRPYRSSMQPIKALALLKEDVDNGKFSRQIFIEFAYSLTDFTKGKRPSVQSWEYLKKSSDLKS